MADERARLRNRPALLGLAVGLAVGETALLSLLGPKTGLALAPQVSAPPPFDVFHDLRWLAVYVPSWLVFVFAVAAFFVARTGITAVLVRESWPSRVERPTDRELLRRAAWSTAVLAVILVPWVVLLFATAVLSLSYLWIVAVPVVVMISRDRASLRDHDAVVAHASFVEQRERHPRLVRRAHRARCRHRRRSGVAATPGRRARRRRQRMVLAPDHDLGCGRGRRFANAPGPAVCGGGARRDSGARDRRRGSGLRGGDDARTWPPRTAPRACRCHWAAGARGEGLQLEVEWFDAPMGDRQLPDPAVLVSRPGRGRAAAPVRTRVDPPLRARAGPRACGNRSMLSPPTADSASASWPRARARSSRSPMCSGRRTHRCVQSLPSVRCPTPAGFRIPRPVGWAGASRPARHSTARPRSSTRWARWMCAPTRPCSGRSSSTPRLFQSLLRCPAPGVRELAVLPFDTGLAAPIPATVSIPHIVRPALPRRPAGRRRDGARVIRQVLRGTPVDTAVTLADDRAGGPGPRVTMAGARAWRSRSSPRGVRLPDPDDCPAMRRALRNYVGVDAWRPRRGPPRPPTRCGDRSRARPA